MPLLYVDPLTRSAKNPVGDAMQIGEVLRYSRPANHLPVKVDGLPNYFHVTHLRGSKPVMMESGVNPIKRVVGPDVIRCPAILISGSPHKIGSKETPWQNSFDPDLGHVRFFGDNKLANFDPAHARGNSVLLEQFGLHSSHDRELRAQSCPIIVFKRVAVGGRKKGNVCFQGYGIIERVELVTQYDRRRGTSFTNYVFQFVLFNLIAEHEVFPWSWISSRRDAKLKLSQTASMAPKAWQAWVREGSPAIEKCRRRVAKLLTTKTAEQQPDTKERGTLTTIYKFYSGKKKNRFESLAAFVASRILSTGGAAYKSGWITPKSADHGADFVGRLDLGNGLSQVKIVVLGQAKCEKLHTPTGGNHIARTVARLKRGWVGVYVTTSYFSVPVQQEVLEDKYPILLINGQRVAQEVLKAVHEKGFATVHAFLLQIDSMHDQQISQREPEQILFD